MRHRPQEAMGAQLGIGYISQLCTDRFLLYYYSYICPPKKKGEGGGSQSTVAGTYFKSRWWEAIVLHLCETLGRHHQALSDRRCGCLAVAVVTQWLLVDAITHQVVYPGLQLHFHSATETIVCSLSSNRIKAGG